MKQPVRFQGLFKETNEIAGKLKANKASANSLKPLFPDRST